MRKGEQDIFTFFLPTRILHGANSLLEAGNAFKSLCASKALVVTDQGVSNAGLLTGLIESLKKSQIPYSTFDNVEEDPTCETVRKGSEFAVSEKCDGIVVLGGGSPICAGRAIGVIVTNGGNIEDYAGLNKAAKPPLPLIAIPTTAGSGSEVSQFIILKNKKTNTKFVAGSPLYFPKVAILDPLLMRTLPYWQSVVSGIDALTHAIEAYLTSLTTPITDALALSSVHYIYHNLRTAATTDDLEAKEACLIGSTMANMACGNARLGLIHGMTNPMEGMFKISHGEAVGTLLPYVMEFNLPASHSRYVNLARNMGHAENEGCSKRVASQAIDAVKELYSDLDFPRKYSDSVVNPNAISEMARMMMAGIYGQFERKTDYAMNSIVPSANIRKATIKDVMRLYEKAFKGW